MYTIEKYNNDIKLLTSSLVIKIHDIGVKVNQGLLITYKYQALDNPLTWKYYLNLSGEKFYLPAEQYPVVVPKPTASNPNATVTIGMCDNADVQVTVIETGVVESLTKALLIKYPGTRKALDQRLNSYKALVNKYPGDVTYIDGCINPIDIQTAIDATDGTILTYSKEYLELQEYSLIRELSKELRLYMSRWYITEYNITDELYLASVLAVMYANIPNMIASIRLEDAGTPEAHSFHIEHFFRSHLDLWDNVKNLKQATIWWLYQNLVSIMNSAGSNQNLSDIINKIFTPNGVWLSTYTLTPSALVHNAIDVPGVPVFTLAEPKFKLAVFNKQYQAQTTTYTILDMVAKEVAGNMVRISNPKVVLDTVGKDAVADIVGNVSLPQPTKIIDFGEVTLYKNYSESLLFMITDQWLVYANENKYIHNVKFIDPNTRLVYDLTPYTAVMLFYYLMLNFLGDKNPVISSITCRTLIDTGITKAELLANTLTATGTDYAANSIINNYPIHTGILRNVNAFQDVIKSSISMRAAVWAIDANVNNAFLSSNIKSMVDKITQPRTVNIVKAGTPTNLSSLLQTNGINVNITPTYDIILTMSELFTTYTGYQLKEETLLQEVYNNHKMLLDKLTSYTTQAIPPIISTGGIPAAYTSISANNAIHGYIGITDANIVKILETAPIQGTANSNNFITATTSFYGGTPNISSGAVDGSLQLVAHTSIGDDTAANTRITSSYAEIMNASYIKYGPATVTVGNNTDANVVSVAASVNPITNISRSPTVNDIYTTAHNDSVSVDVSATAELLGSDTTIYAPASSNVGNNLDGNNVSLAQDTGSVVGITTQPTTDGIYVTASNAIVTSNVTATAEILGTNFKKP